MFIFICVQNCQYQRIKKVLDIFFSNSHVYGIFLPRNMDFTLQKLRKIIFSTSGTIAKSQIGTLYLFQRILVIFALIFCAEKINSSNICWSSFWGWHFCICGIIAGFNHCFIWKTLNDRFILLFYASLELAFPLYCIYKAIFQSVY